MEDWREGEGGTLLNPGVNIKCGIQFYTAIAVISRFTIITAYNYGSGYSKTIRHEN